MSMFYDLLNSNSNLDHLERAQCPNCKDSNTYLVEEPDFIDEKNMILTYECDKCSIEFKETYKKIATEITYNPNEE